MECRVGDNVYPIWIDSRSKDDGPMMIYINNGIIDSLNIKTIGKTNRNISLSL
jgi:hypothetical protein